MTPSESIVHSIIDSENPSHDRLTSEVLEGDKANGWSNISCPVCTAKQEIATEAQKQLGDSDSDGMKDVKYDRDDYTYRSVQEKHTQVLLH